MKQLAGKTITVPWWVQVLALPPMVVALGCALLLALAFAALAAIPVLTVAALAKLLTSTGDRMMKVAKDMDTVDAEVIAVEGDPFGPSPLFKQEAERGDN